MVAAQVSAQPNKAGGTSAVDAQMSVLEIGDECVLLDDVTCAICLSILHEPASLQCGHTFCSRCVQRNHGMSVRCLWTRGQKAMLKSWYLLLLPVHFLLLFKCGGTCFQLLKFKTGSFAWKVGGHIMISKPRLLHGLCWRGSWRL